MSLILEGDFTEIDHNMASGQKLNIDEIRRVAPDAIEISNIKRDGPERKFGLYLLKGQTYMHFNHTEVEPDLCVNGFALLKQEFKVVEWTLWGTPLLTEAEVTKLEQINQQAKD